MQTQLTSVVVLVRSIPKSLHLYRDGLNLTLLSKTDTFARFAVSPSLTLDLRQATSEAQLSTGYSPFLNFAIDDMDSAVPRLLGLGAALDGGVRYNDYGRTAAVRSPDGIMIGLYESAGIPEGGDAKLAAKAAAKRRLDEGRGE